MTDKTTFDPDAGIRYAKRGDAQKGNDMEAPTAGNLALVGGETAKQTRRGRVEPDGQEANPDPKIIEGALPELERLYRRKQDANADFNAAVKDKAKKAGFNASVVKKFITVRANEQMEEERRKQDQLALLFFDISSAA